MSENVILKCQTPLGIYEHTLRDDETVSSIRSIQFRDDPVWYYAVGTTFVDPEESEPTRGRIQIFEVRDRSLLLIAVKEVKGAVTSLASFNGRLASAVSSRLFIWGWEESEDGSKQLSAVANTTGHVMTLQIKARGDYIIGADLMKSLSVYHFEDQHSRVAEVARDHAATWPVVRFLLHPARPHLILSRYCSLVNSSLMTRS